MERTPPRLRFATPEEESAFQEFHESYRTCYRPADDRESKCALRYLLQFQMERKRNNIQEKIEAKREAVIAESWETADATSDLPTTAIGFVQATAPVASRPKGKGLPPKARRWR